MSDQAPNNETQPITPPCQFSHSPLEAETCPGSCLKHEFAISVDSTPSNDVTEKIYIKLKQFSTGIKQSPSLSPPQSFQTVLCSLSAAMSRKNSSVEHSTNEPATLAANTTSSETVSRAIHRTPKTLPSEIKGFSWRESIVLALYYLQQPSTMEGIRNWVELNIVEKYHEIYKSSVSSILAQHKGKVWRIAPDSVRRQFSSRVKYELMKGKDAIVKPLLEQFIARIGTIAGEVPALQGFNRHDSDLFTLISQSSNLGNSSGEDMAVTAASLAAGDVLARIDDISATSQALFPTSVVYESIEPDDANKINMTGLRARESDETTLLGSDQESIKDVAASSIMPGRFPLSTLPSVSCELTPKVIRKTTPELEAEIQYPCRRELLVDFEPPILIKPHKIPRKGGLTAKQMNETSAAFVQHQFKRKRMEDDHANTKKQKIRDDHIAKARMSDEMFGEEPIVQGINPTPGLAPRPSQKGGNECSE